MNRKLMMTGLAAVLLGASCSKEEGTVEDHTHVGGNTIVAVQYNWKWGADTYDDAQMYTTNLGEPVRFTRVRFFMGQPHFKDDGGTTVADFPATYLLADKATSGQIQNFGQVNGHLHTLEMIIGVDSATNHSDPTLNDAPLDDATMHWNWNPAFGYIFLKLEGRYDSDNDGDVDNSDNTFIYDCGGDVLRRDAVFNIHTDALTGGTLIIDLTVDMAQLVHDLDIQADDNEHSPSPITEMIMDNLVLAVTHE